LVLTWFFPYIFNSSDEFNKSIPALPIKTEEIICGRQTNYTGKVNGDL